jgi:hypothetical protein
VVFLLFLILFSLELRNKDFFRNKEFWVVSGALYVQVSTVQEKKISDQETLKGAKGRE